MDRKIIVKNVQTYLCFCVYIEWIVYGVQFWMFCGILLLIQCFFQCCFVLKYIAFSVCIFSFSHDKKHSTLQSFYCRSAILYCLKFHLHYFLKIIFNHILIWASSLSNKPLWGLDFKMPSYYLECILCKLCSYIIFRNLQII